MSKIKGKNFKVAMGGVVIAMSRSCELQMESETIEVASTTSGAFREYIAGRKTWSASVGYLVSSVEDRIVKVGDKVALSFITDGNALCYGFAICTACRITAQVGSMVQGSFTFKGTGEITYEEE